MVEYYRNGKINIGYVLFENQAVRSDSIVLKQSFHSTKIRQRSPRGRIFKIPDPQKPFDKLEINHRILLCLTFFQLVQERDQEMSKV